MLELSGLAGLGNRTGNNEFCAILTECTWAPRTNTYSGAQFHRFYRRFGKTGGGKVAIATAHTLMPRNWLPPPIIDHTRHPAQATDPFLQVVRGHRSSSYATSA